MYYIPSDLLIGSIHRSNNHGQFEVIDYKGCKDVTIRFVGTGTVIKCESDKARKGAVRDFLYPSVYGNGCLGYGDYNSKRDKKAYKCWSEMLKRCYSPKYHERKPTYSDCTVCDEWLNFQSFAKWYYDNFPNDGGIYQIDKDIKIDGNRQYRPEACMFVTPAENTAKCNECRMYDCEVVSPDGKLVKITNQRDFCKEYNVDYRAINAVILGKRNHHKGWTKA